MSKHLPDDPLQFAQWLRDRAEGHAPGYDIAIYGRPHQWLALADGLRASAQEEREPDGWQYRVHWSDGWGPWHVLDWPIDRFKETHAHTLAMGKMELRPLFAAPYTTRPEKLNVVEYIAAWEKAIYDATGDQKQTDRAIELAEVRGLFDPCYVGSPK